MPATYDAPSASTTEAASVAMWPASASRASEPETSQPTISSDQDGRGDREHDPQARAVAGPSGRVAA